MNRLAASSVRYLLIGVSGANLYGPAGQAVFLTDDFDLFLPPDADNLVRAWIACEDVPLELWLGNEPLDAPRDRWLAQRVIERRALTRATGTNALIVDLTLASHHRIETSRGATEGSTVPRHAQGRAGAAAQSS